MGKCALSNSELEQWEMGIITIWSAVQNVCLFEYLSETYFPKCFNLYLSLTCISCEEFVIPHHHH